jgi:branched-chain amino acid transport system permease protein
VSFGTVSVLKNLELMIHGRKIQALIGPNGAGKTTLINAITGRIKLKMGQISLGHIYLNRLNQHQIVRNGIIRTFQSPTIFGTLTVADNLQLTSFKGKLPSLHRRRLEVPLNSEVFDLLKQKKMEDKLELTANSLSHGDQKALELCMALNMNPKMLLLDEPTAGLTQEERKAVGNILLRLVRQQNFALFIVEHDIDFLKEVAEKVAVLYEGKIIACGSFDEITNNSLVKKIYLGMKD